MITFSRKLVTLQLDEVVVGCWIVVERDGGSGGASVFGTVTSALTSATSGFGLTLMTFFIFFVILR